MAEAKTDPLSIETLFRAAFERTKDRFWSYILTLLLSIGMVLLAVLVIGIGAAINAGIIGVTQNAAVSITVATISFVAALAGIFYISAWGTLATAYVIIAKEKMGAMEVYKQVQPLVWRYVGFSLLTSLFFIGLVPISIPTLFILLLVWGIWGCLSIFTFLDKKEKGLMPLWESKALVSKRFWGILVRVGVMYILFWIVSVLLTVAAEEYRILSVLNFVFSILIGPFAISYLYEIYKNLSATHTEKAAPAKIWIVISIIGWVLLLLAGFGMAQSAKDLGDKQMKNIIQKQMMQKKIDSI